MEVLSSFSVRQLNEWLRSVVSDNETLQIFEGEYMLISSFALIVIIQKDRARTKN